MIDRVKFGRGDSIPSDVELRLSAVTPGTGHIFFPLNDIPFKQNKLFRFGKCHYLFGLQGATL